MASVALSEGLEPCYSAAAATGNKVCGLQTTGLKKKKKQQQAAQRERKYQGFPNKPPIGRGGFQHKGEKKIRLQEGERAAAAAPPL